MNTISIIVPMHNVAQYIERCLCSITSQTYRDGLECILVDDGSTDNTVSLVKQFISIYKGTICFKLFCFEKNRGQSAARNEGMKIAKNDYVLYVDSDDEIPVDAVELLAKEVVRHPGIDVVMGRMIDDKHSEYYNLDPYINHQYISDNKWIQYNIFCYGKNIPINPVNKLIRRKFILDNSLYFKEGIIHEDDHWMFYVVQHVKTWAFVFEPTYIRYWNEGSIMTSSSKVKEETSWIKIMVDHSEHFYGPFKKLQLARYLNKYFCQWMFLARYPESKKLHINFFLACIRMHLWKGVFLLFVWRLFYIVCDGFWAKKWLMEYSLQLFVKETNRWKSEYGV